jgi:myosin heavy subunit
MEKKQAGEVKKVNTIGYKVTIGILLAIIAILLWILLYSREEIKAVRIEKEQIQMTLTGEVDSLMVEQTNIKREYGELSEQARQKDSIITANAIEIKKLIAKSADYRRIKRKLNYLRKIQQSYVDQLDSLYTANRELKEELDVAHQEISQKTQQTKQLNKEKEQLAKIVQTGSILKAYNVKGTTYHLKGKNKREAETFKARRVDRVKIRFTIGENPLAIPGKRDVYIRIARPDGLIISKGRGDEYSFDVNGTRLQYSMKKEIDYQNKSIDVELNWDKQTDTPAMVGKYHVAIYLDGKMIGQNQFELE